MKYIIINARLLDGIGDWVHLYEVSKFIKKYLLAHDLRHIQLVAFVAGENKSQVDSFAKSDECKKLFAHFFYAKVGYPSFAHEEIKSFEEECTEEAIKSFQQVDELPVPKSDIKSMWREFMQANESDVLSVFTFLTTFYVPSNIPEFVLIENGCVTDELDYHNKLFVRMDMGIGLNIDNRAFAMARGIRIHPGWREFLNQSPAEIQQGRISFFNKLSTKFEAFTLVLNPLLQSVKRHFIPADLRDKDILLSFIQMYSKLYAYRCDFYLPKRLLSSDSCRVQIKVILDNKCVFITPDSRVLDDEINPDYVRIFYGFELSDSEYKELYLYSGQSGAGSAGDDTFCTTVSSFNLPIHQTNGIQSYLREDISKYTHSMGLATLTKYFEKLPWCDEHTDWDGLYVLLSNEQLHTEWRTFCKFVVKYYDVYNWLETALDELLVRNDKLTIKDRITKIKATFANWDEKLEPQRVRQVMSTEFARHEYERSNLSARSALIFSSIAVAAISAAPYVIESVNQAYARYKY